MEIVLRTAAKRLIFAIHSTGPAAVVDVYVADRRDARGPEVSEKVQPLGQVEFAEVVRMAKAILGLRA